MKNDEKALLLCLQKRTKEDPNNPYVRQLVLDLSINGKRAAYICGKWANKGWYEYGVNVLAGWLTEEGKQVDVGPLLFNGKEVSVACAVACLCP